MCLDIITKTNLNQSGTGWKVFMGRKGKLHSHIRSTTMPKKINCWLRAKKRSIQTDYAGSDNRYMSGFHIFLRKKDAAEWKNNTWFKGADLVISKVKYRKGHTMGTQTVSFFDRVRIIVAHEMFIIQGDK